MQISGCLEEEARRKRLQKGMRKFLRVLIAYDSFMDVYICQHVSNCRIHVVFLYANYAPDKAVLRSGAERNKTRLTRG